MTTAFSLPIGILGGTFDPVHRGHLSIALALYQQLDLQEIRFIPCQMPILKKTVPASADDRLKMLQLAIAGQTGLRIDDRELVRATPSYTVDTLLSLRQELAATPLCLILGSDAFNSLPQWHRWQELLQLAHLLIVPRADYPIITVGTVGQLLQQRQTMDPKQLRQQIAGCIFITDIHPLPISSTLIRQQIQDNLNSSYLLPEGVWEYIRQHNLYHHPIKNI